jgi:hypothetical protein
MTTKHRSRHWERKSLERRDLDARTKYLYQLYLEGLETGTATYSYVRRAMA